MCAPDDGWRCHPKHVEQFPDINKLCNVASCWIYIGIYLGCTDPWTLNIYILCYWKAWVGRFSHAALYLFVSNRSSGHGRPSCGRKNTLKDQRATLWIVLIRAQSEAEYPCVAEWWLFVCLTRLSGCTATSFTACVSIYTGTSLKTFVKSRSLNKENGVLFWNCLLRGLVGNHFHPKAIIPISYWNTFDLWKLHNPYPIAFPYGNGMVLHFYQQQESSTTKTLHKVINKGLKAYV